MNMIIPLIGFSLIVIGLLIFIGYFVNKSSEMSNRWLLYILGWLGLTGSIASTGYFTHFYSMPPRIFLVILPVIISVIFLARAPKLSVFFNAVPLVWLILIQAFRIDMEIILWLLEKQALIPELITWNGRNFDIVIGLSAPLIAYFCYVKKPWANQVALIWNYLGIGFLLHVFILGLLSAPTPFRVFFTNPETIFIAHVPYIWLPGFVLPLAIFFHVAAIRKIKAATDPIEPDDKVNAVSSHREAESETEAAEIESEEVVELTETQAAAADDETIELGGAQAAEVDSEKAVENKDATQVDDAEIEEIVADVQVESQDGSDTETK